MKCLHRIPWKRLVVSILVLNNGVVIPREEKKKRRLRAGFPTMNQRESGAELVGVAGALAEGLPSKSVTLPAPVPVVEVGIALLQWNMQAFCMLIKPPPCSADLSGRDSSAPQSMLRRQAAFLFSRADLRERFRSCIELSSNSSSCLPPAVHCDA